MILKILKLKSIIAGIETNCYIIVDEDTKETIVIDPGGEIEKIIKTLELLDAKVKYIYLTHCHADHIGEVRKLKEMKGGNILIHKEDYDGLKNPEINLTGFMTEKEIIVEADSRVNNEDVIHIGQLEFEVIHTPGHTKGGSCLYYKKKKMLFAGDTIFKGTWGRTDMPTGNFEDVIKSITNKILVLPDDTIIYPGHGSTTRVVEEEPIYYGLSKGID